MIPELPERALEPGIQVPKAIRYAGFRYSSQALSPQTKCWKFVYEYAYLPLQNHGVKRLHQLRNRAREVPPMDIEQINIAGLQFLQAGFQ